MALWRVEAQELVVKTFEAETQEEACIMMYEYLQDCDHRDLDWTIDAYRKEEKAKGEAD